MSNKEFNKEHNQPSKQGQGQESNNPKHAQGGKGQEQRTGQNQKDKNTFKKG